MPAAEGSAFWQGVPDVGLGSRRLPAPPHPPPGAPLPAEGCSRRPAAPALLPVGRGHHVNASPVLTGNCCSELRSRTQHFLQRKTGAAHLTLWGLWNYQWLSLGKEAQPLPLGPQSVPCLFLSPYHSCVLCHFSLGTLRKWHTLISHFLKEKE